MSAPPLIIGHRGAAAVAPENTLAGFTRALRDGADGIEFDVRLAHDLVPVVIHDATLQRTALTGGNVGDLSALQLGRIDVGSRFNCRYPQAATDEFARETVPTLKRVFEVLAETRCLLYLEMKFDREESELLAAKVVNLIRKHSLRHRVIVESFDLSSLESVKRIDAGIRTAALFEPRLRRPVSLLQGMRMVDLASRCGANEIALHKTLVSRQVVEKATKHGLPVVVWTVDDCKWKERARSLGLRALITNDPGKMVQACRQ
jgi:glycerophosphoryl diester phosphodiesterase